MYFFWHSEDLPICAALPKSGTVPTVLYIPGKYFMEVLQLFHL